MDANELAETIMNPETRVLKQITMDDVENASKVFMSLMGDDADCRKVFIEKNSWRANLDI